MSRWLILLGLTFVVVAPARADDPAAAPDSGDDPTATEPAEDAAGEAAPEKTAAEPYDLTKTERLTGDWFGARSFLEDHGVTFSLGLTTIFQENCKGGVQTRHAHDVTGSYDAELTLDMEALKLWQGGTFYTLVSGGWGPGISGRGYVGDRFGVNFDASGDRGGDVLELWYEHSLFDKKLRIRFGKIDLTRDFDTNAFANDETSQFLNYGLRNTATIPWPQMGQGLQFVATPWEWMYFGAAVADADADYRSTGFHSAYHGPAHTFSIYEAGLTPKWQTGWGLLSGNYRFGLWYDPQPKEQYYDDLDGRLTTAPIRTDDTGFYLNFDQVVFRENPLVEGDEQGLGLFFRYGYAHADVNTIEDFWSVGGQYQGLIPTRDKDVLAFGVAQGILSEQMRLTGADPHRETALETYYRIQIFPWLTLSPDLQWILRPGGEDGRDAFVLGLRLQANF